MKSLIAFFVAPIRGFDLANDDISTVNCKDYNGMCSREFRAVCGNDGFARANPCIFLSEYCMGNINLRFNSWGQCMANDAVNEPEEPEKPEGKEDCNGYCGRIYAPVCGSDGAQYANECLLNYENCKRGGGLRIAPCPRSCSRPCPRIYTPVCASDGVTYSNECTFGIAQCEAGNDPELPPLELVSEGHCEMMNDFVEVEEPECKTNCGRVVKAVCGDDGETYPNKCVLNRKNCQEGTEIEIAHKGECKKCPTICTRDYRPVCGSNGETYSNACGLEVDSCQRPDENIEMVHSGRCMANDVTNEPDEPEKPEEKEKCNSICGRILDRVCGSDGVIYPNPCILKFKSCEEGTDVRIVPCKKDCARMCSRIGLPVCGSDGVTYGNECMFEMAQCEKSNDPENAPLTLIGQGPCMANDWTEVQEPEEPIEPKEPHSLADADCAYHLERECPKFSNQSYCGSDRVTYPHICHFRKARCRNPDLIVKSNKFCKKKNKDKYNFVNGRFMGFMG